MSEAYSLKEIQAVTRAVRRADEEFAATGGHWVIELFLPALSKEGLKLCLNKSE